MTRRKDIITAERLSVALLTRAAFGPKAGWRAAMFYGIHPKLAEEVFNRPVSGVRIVASGTSVVEDRRKRSR